MKTDAEVVVAMTKCLASYGRHLATSMGGEVIEHENFVVCNPHFEVKDFESKAKNMVVPLRTLTPTEAIELARIILELYEYPDTCVVWTLADQPNLSVAGFGQHPAINAAMTLSNALSKSTCCISKR